MIRMRPSGERGHAEHGWLSSRHSFSFADYYDPEEMGFGDLRVINEDHIRGGGGFAAHPHRNMEILTYVLDGALRHEDSMGNGSIIRAGDVQRMSAGTGVVHSEANASPDTSVHLFQIWVLPDRQGYTPEYEQQTPPAAGRQGRFQVLASGAPQDPGLHWHQDARLLTAELTAEDKLSYPLKPGRMAYLQVTRGIIHLGDHTLKDGDACRIQEESSVSMTTSGGAAILLFDLRAAS